MIRRLVWFVAGAVGGAAGTVMAGRRVKRRVRDTVDQMAPTRVARQAGRRVRSSVEGVAEAVRDGRSAMRDKESELRARLQGRAETIAPVDAVFVDGERLQGDDIVVVRGVDSIEVESRESPRRPTRSRRAS